MKRKLCLVILVLSGGLMAVFAGAADPCVEKQTACIDSCTNVEAQCKSRGGDPSGCENAAKRCKAACDKTKADCDSKKTNPKKPEPKKPAPKKN